MPTVRPRGKIRLFPQLRISPVLGLVRALNHGIKGRIDFHALHDVERLFMLFIADAVGIVSRCHDKKEQWLYTSSKTLSHNVNQLSVWLCSRYSSHFCEPSIFILFDGEVQSRTMSTATLKTIFA